MRKIPEIPPFTWYAYPEDNDILEIGCIYCTCIDMGVHGEATMFLLWDGFERGWRYPGIQVFFGADDVEVLDISHFMHIPLPDYFD